MHSSLNRGGKRVTIGWRHRHRNGIEKRQNRRAASARALYQREYAMLGGASMRCSTTRPVMAVRSRTLNSPRQVMIAIGFSKLVRYKEVIFLLLLLRSTMVMSMMSRCCLYCWCFPPRVLSVLTFKVHQDFYLGPSTIPALSKVPGRRARPRTLDHDRYGIEFLRIASWSNVRARPSVFDICRNWQIFDILGWGIFDPGEARKEKRKGKGEGRKKRKKKKRREKRGQLDILWSSMILINNIMTSLTNCLYLPSIPANFAWYRQKKRGEKGWAQSASVSSRSGMVGKDVCRRVAVSTWTYHKKEELSLRHLACNEWDLIFHREEYLSTGA